MTEDEELEEFNRLNNERLSSRPIDNLITCPHCDGRGGFFSPICEPPYLKCSICKGKKYVSKDLKLITIKKKRKCEYCEGRGSVTIFHNPKEKAKCVRCRGEGRYEYTTVESDNSDANP